MLASKVASDASVETEFGWGRTVTASCRRNAGRSVEKHRCSRLLRDSKIARETPPKKEGDSESTWQETQTAVRERSCFYPGLARTKWKPCFRFGPRSSGKEETIRLLNTPLANHPGSQASLVTVTNPKLHFGPSRTEREKLF